MDSVKLAEVLDVPRHQARCLLDNLRAAGKLTILRKEGRLNVYGVSAGHAAASQPAGQPGGFKGWLARKAQAPATPKPVAPTGPAQLVAAQAAVSTLCVGLLSTGELVIEHGEVRLRLPRTDTATLVAYLDQARALCDLR